MKGAAWAAVLHSAANCAPVQVLELGAMAIREPGARLKRGWEGGAGAARRRVARERVVVRVGICIFGVVLCFLEGFGVYMN